MDENKKVLDCEVINIILEIPKDTAALQVTSVMVSPSGEVTQATAEFSADQVREMRKNFLDNLYDDDYNATYELTEKGRAYLEALERGDNIELQED